MKGKTESEALKSVESGERVGVFGGTFNPLHVGHINCIATAHDRLKLDKIVVVPAAQNPKKLPVEGPSHKQRIEMLEKGLEEHPYALIDDQEIARGGPSYTVATLEAYAEKISSKDLYLIMGLDQFFELDKWKDYEKILTLANLVVLTRPNHEIPFSEEEFPEGVKKLVDIFDRQYVALKSGRSIEFMRLKDVDVSATDIRKRLRTGRNVDRHLSIPVEEYIREQGLYAPIGPKVGDYKAFTNFCAQALYARKAINVRGFDLRPTTAPTEFALIASGTSTRHASALAEAVQRAVKEEFNVFPQSIEGAGEGRWVLLDYGSLIVHVFYDFVRQEYRLEELWKAGKDLGLVDESEKPAAK
jgi:nicotinate-nucleotide adenylyltransferase